ncbi:tol-pal system-associated acyl-CoA thioesterase [Novosphingobium sp. SG720]|uniref:tol-pal system-associated acyl-CoA thioesterase n=1 Tax=Novosphingobium sp. SG720 TaxID=2586998 RepID=UPI001448902A|nr:tol-pal system-associated acyl-CoA thioesterase [Novosphingobium sp. SG720]NKJ41130.1 acyl-CoA thioester hydrolase [Novosphingobium sp. SG720]
MNGPDFPAGCLDGKTHRFAVRVYYEDTDLSGVVYHANYLRWFERARSDLLRLIGIDQRAAHEAGEGAFAVADMALRYASPARLDDGVVIESRLAALQGASVTLLQQAFRRATLLCTARVRVAFVTPGGRPRRLPPAWHDAFAALIVSEQDLEKARP